MKKTLFVLLFVIGSLWTSSASANTITYKFTGAVTSELDIADYMPGIEVGTSLYGFLTYDTSGIHTMQSDLLQVFISGFEISAIEPIAQPPPGFYSFRDFRVNGPGVSPRFHSETLYINWNGLNPYASPGSLFVEGHDYLAGLSSFNASIEFTPVPDTASSGLLMLLGISAIQVVRRLQATLRADPSH
jgi:hypothetical protein